MKNFGVFLHELRKEKGMTQAALAERLGVTNKAVSKWETGEAMPDTSLLLPLAEVFGVTVDELLSGKRANNEKCGTEQKANIADEIKGHIFTRGKDDEPETTLDRICGIICAFIILGGITVYLFLGAFAGLWNPYWIIVPTCALSCGIVGIIFNLCDRQKRIKKLSNGKNPYVDCACGIIFISCVIVYLFLGAIASLWHPYWVILIAGGAVCGVVGAIGNYFSSKK
ncbi:MAG: helix-turn-helix domain-containing protein [Clostridia bacterium]|nr:helix-turn-helix domain-containing protein [Clostridia bacterium]